MLDLVSSFDRSAQTEEADCPTVSDELDTFQAGSTLQAILDMPMFFSLG